MDAIQVFDILNGSLYFIQVEWIHTWQRALSIDACPFAPAQRDTATDVHASCRTSLPCGASHKAQRLQPHSNSGISQGLIADQASKKKKTLAHHTKRHTEGGSSIIGSTKATKCPLKMKNAMHREVLWNGLQKMSKTCHISQGSIKSWKTIARTP